MCLALRHTLGIKCSFGAAGKEAIADEVTELLDSYTTRSIFGRRGAKITAKCSRFRMSTWFLCFHRRSPAGAPGERQLGKS